MLNKIFFFGHFDWRHHDWGHSDPGKNGKFYWTVFGKRSIIDVEPNKTDVEINGYGPYKYINKTFS